MISAVIAEFKILIEFKPLTPFLNLVQYSIAIFTLAR